MSTYKLSKVLTLLSNNTRGLTLIGLGVRRYSRRKEEKVRLASSPCHAGASRASDFCFVRLANRRKAIICIWGSWPISVSLGLIVLLAK